MQEKLEVLFSKMYLRSYKRKSVLVLISGFSFSCFMHFSQIYSNRAKPERFIPDQRIKIEFTRIPEKLPLHNNGLENFNNRNFDNYFLHSSFFILDKSANLKISYSSQSKDLGISGSSSVLWLFTLGGIPYKRDSQSRVTFTIIDKKSSMELGSYEYTINQSIWFGWLSIPVSLVIIPFANTVKELTTDESLALHDRIAGRFTRDFLSDIKKGMYANSAAPKKIKTKATYLIMEGTDTDKKYIEQSKMLSNLLEVALVNSSYKITDRKYISSILKEQALSLSGLTKNDVVKVGNLSGAGKMIISNILHYGKTDDIYSATYIINITDINTGEVEWKNLYTVKGTTIEEMFQQGSISLLKDLSFAGYQ